VILKIFLICLVWEILFRPSRSKKYNVKNIITYVLFVICSSIFLFVFHMNKFWLFILAGGKISILNLYEICQMLLETESEREMEQIRRLKLWIKSMGYYLLLTICLAG